MFTCNADCLPLGIMCGYCRPNNVYVAVACAGVVRPLGGRARAHGGAVEAAHLPGGGGVLRAAAARAAPAPARPRAARAHHIGTLTLFIYTTRQ